MPFYVFTEDEKGRLGYIGTEFYSEVKAQDEADDYEGITHVIQADDLKSAKRLLRKNLAKKKKDLGQLYRNVRN